MFIFIGLVTGYLEEWLWILFYRLIDVSKPLFSIIALVIFYFRGIPIITTFMESIALERRVEIESRIMWGEFEKPSPTASNVPQITATIIPTLQNSEPTTESRGAYYMLAIDTETGANFEYAYQGTSEYNKLIANGARPISQISRQEVISKKGQEQKAKWDSEIRSSQNDLLNELKPRLMAEKKEFVKDGCGLL
jgi:hypothetical protein